MPPTKTKKSKSPSSKKTRRVRISSTHQVKHYNLDSDEKRMKRESSSPRKSRLPNCDHGKFPCVKRGVIFDTEEEWNDYLENQITRNISTGHRSISAHRKSVLSHLSRQGKTAKFIPSEWRLYNINTGEIIDMRTLDPKSLNYKTLK